MMFLVSSVRRCAVGGFDLDLAGSRDPRLADDRLGLVLLEQKLDALGEFAHHLVLVRHHGGKIERHLRLDAELGEFLARLLEALAGVQQRLGRDAADIEAGAAEASALVDASRFEAKLAQPDRGVVAAGSAADDDGIELFGHVVGLSLGRRRKLGVCGAARNRRKHAPGRPVFRSVDAIDDVMGDWDTLPQRSMWATTVTWANCAATRSWRSLRSSVT